MAHFRLVARARADVDSIAEYTLATWGPERTRRYLDVLNNTFRELALRPEMGTKRPEFGAALRSFPAGSHIVFYKSLEDGIAIVRLLHKRQDPSLHL